MRFGIIGTNFISNNFMDAAKHIKDFELIAVCSGKEENAKKFAQKYGAKKVFTSWEEMARSGMIDAVYIATLNYLHCKQTLEFLDNDIHVLCEKPMASNIHEVKLMINKAIEKGVVLMEAMKPTLMPNFIAVKENLNNIGKIRRAIFNYGKYSSRYDAYREGIILNAFKPEMSNGSIMDIGVYSIFNAVTLFGMPKKVYGNAIMLESGVDGIGSIILSYDDKEVILMHSKITDTTLPSEIQGEDGTIVIDDINSPSKITLYDKYKNEIESLNVNTLPINTSYGKYKNNWVYYSTPTFGLENTDNYLKELNNNQDLIISEVSTDKIEIRNTINENINLSAYSISLKNNNPIKLGNKSILGKGYYTINTPFTINNNSDTLYLYKDNQIIDILPLGKISSTISRGRTEDGQTVLYKNTTFGSKNSNIYYLGYSLAPEYSINNTYVNKGDTISLSTTDNSKIYYTLDGSNPNKNSTLYKEPIKMNKTQIIKAIAIKDNYIESTIQSRLYIVGRQHTLPVISIQTNNENLFSMQSGILVQGYFNNYRQDWYKPINFDYYESDGTLGVTFNGDMKLVGQDSREQPQKSMAIYLKKEYGLKNITYPFFDDDATTIKSFVLRNSGEDPNRIRIKDTFLSEVLKDQMDIDMQKYRAVVVYINGKYYGLYNLREKLNENYIVSNYEIEKGNIDLIKGVNSVQAGTITEYNNLLNYLRNHDTRKEEVYKYLETQIDIDEVINYWIVQTYYRNTDTGNIRYWKEHNGGKWRIMLFDQDWSMYPSTYKTPDLFYPFLPNGHGTGNYFSTLMTYKLYQNETFKDKYLTTFAYHLKNTFNPDRMLSILDNMIKEVESEMPYHIDRWYNEYKTSNMNPIKNMDMWYNNLDKFKTVIKERYSIVLNSIQKEFNLTNSEYEKYFGDLK